MNLSFDMAAIRTVEFGVGRDTDGESTYSLVSVDETVQTALKEMVEATISQLEELEPERFNPAEKHGSREHVWLPLTDDLASRIRTLHEAGNLTTEASAVESPGDIDLYFARLTDTEGRTLTAVRRAAQFKGVLRSRLIRLVSDSLKMVEDDVFKLDQDFDLIADGDEIHILRPTSFEFLGQLQDAILAAVPTNVKALKAELTFVDFSPIELYASHHPRAARYLASIRAQGGPGDVDRDALAHLCAVTNVDVTVSDDQLVVADHDVLAFLEVLDRRRYEIELVLGSPERFKASARSRLEDP